MVFILSPLWWRRIRGYGSFLIPRKLLLPIIPTGHSGGASSKEPSCRCRRFKRHRFDPWVGKIPWRRKWQPTAVFLLQYLMDRGDWQATVHRVRKSWTWLKQLSIHISPTVAQEITKCEDMLKKYKVIINNLAITFTIRVLMLKHFYILLFLKLFLYLVSKIQSKNRQFFSRMRWTKQSIFLERVVIRTTLIFLKMPFYLN